MKKSQQLQLNPVKERLMFLSPTVQGGLEREANTNDFEIKASLGTGAFGKVFKVAHKKTKLIYAIKQISKKQIKSQKMVPQIKNEIKIMYSVHHENIIKLYNHFEEDDYIYLIIEYAPGGQLWYKLNQVGRFDEETVKAYLRDIIAAVEYLHNREPAIIHRDIKPENLLLDANNRVKLADFGWSNFFNDTKRITYCGTLDYLAPEMILEIGHDKTLDIWSLGVLIYELLTGKAPFAPNSDLKDQKDKQRALEENVVNIRINFPNDFPQLAQNLLSKILRKNPNQRIGLEEIKQHPWLKINNNAIHQEIAPKNEPPSGQSQKFVKIQAKDLEILNDPEGFDADQIADLANKKGVVAILNMNEKPKPKKQEKQENSEKNNELFSYSTNNEDLKQKTFEELNEKVKHLMEKNSELEVNFKKKCIEFENLSKDYEKLKTFDTNNEISGTVDLRKYRLLEEEKKNLKREFDHLWETLKEKENLIQKQSQDLKRFEEIKRANEKYKQEKANYQEKIKKYQEEIESHELRYNQLKADTEEEKLKYEMQLKHRQISGKSPEEELFGGVSQQTIMKELGRIMEDLKEKIENYKENMEESLKNSQKLQELETEVNRLRSNREIELNEFQSKLNETHEEEIEELKLSHKKQLEEIEEKAQKQAKEYETLVNSLKKEINSRNFAEIEFESLKKQLELTNKSLVDVKQDWETMKKLKNILENQIKEQSVKLRDQEDLIKKFSKK